MLSKRTSPDKPAFDTENNLASSLQHSAGSGTKHGLAIAQRNVWINTDVDEDELLGVARSMTPSTAERYHIIL